MSNILASTSESERQLYLNTFKERTDYLISWSLQQGATDSSVIELAMTQTLRHKGRILDSSINSFQQLEKTLSVEDQQLLDDIISNRTELSNLYFSGLGNRSLEQYQAEVDYLKGNIQNLETVLARRSAEFRIESQPVSVQTVQALIPNNAVLVELIHYNPLDFDDIQNRWAGPPPYAAY